jgi:hypothetical protein
MASLQRAFSDKFGGVIEVTSPQARPGPASRGPLVISLADLGRSLLSGPGKGQPSVSSVISSADLWRSLLCRPGHVQPPEGLQR